jgi:hypothetical protein
MKIRNLYHDRHNDKNKDIKEDKLLSSVFIFFFDSLTPFTNLNYRFFPLKFPHMHLFTIIQSNSHVKYLL